MKTIYILLTRSGTFLSKLVHLLTADRYTHASISFDECLQPLYSSARKNGETMFPAGPCREYFHRGFYKKNQHIPCALYTLQVPENAFEEAQKEIMKIISQSDEYHFNILGLLLCRMNIPFNRSNKFFCSQFVAEILQRSQAMELPKAPSVIRPSDYTRMNGLECVYRGTLQELVTSRGGLI